MQNCNEAFEQLLQADGENTIVTVFVGNRYCPANWMHYTDGNGVESFLITVTFHTKAVLRTLYFTLTRDKCEMLTYDLSTPQA